MFSSNSSPMTMDRRWKTNIETAPNCPRCASANTKFCYYNNYSLSQPRYFCKSCRRYWTKGGSLRNVPFGGACRKNRRGKPVRGPSDHLGSGSGSGSGSYQPNSDSSSDGSCGDPFTTGSDIDLAVVFSNFLNPVGSGSTLPEMESPDYDLDAIHFPPENENVVDFQGRLEIPMSGTDYTGVEFEQYMDPGIEMGVDAMQTLLGDDIDQDILWSETVDENSLPNLSWEEQQTELHEFEGVVDDHSMFHNNLLNGNWSSFDIPSYGA